jgi:hypothetical protein
MIELFEYFFARSKEKRAVNALIDMNLVQKNRPEQAIF